MTTSSPEPAPALPLAGPASADGVKQHLGVSDDRDDNRLAAIVAAVNAKVRRWPCSERALGQEDWTGAEDVVEGANLLASRLFRRKNSPAGVEAFGADGAVYVQRQDPDVAMLLGLGPWQRPEVG